MQSILNPRRLSLAVILLLVYGLAHGQATLTLDPPTSPTRILLDFQGGPAVKVFFWFEVAGSSGEQKTTKTDQLLLGSSVQIHSATNATGASNCGAVQLPKMVKDSIFISVVGTYSFSVFAIGPCATGAPPLPVLVDPTGIVRIRTGEAGHGAVIEFVGTVIGGGGPGAHKGKSGCCCGMSYNGYDDLEQQSDPVLGMHAQVRENLCWAAVAQTVLSRILSREFDQCELATEILGSDGTGCTNAPNSLPVNDYLRKEIGTESWYTTDRNFTHIPEGLASSDSMLPVFVQWNDGGFGGVGHFMVLIDASVSPVTSPHPDAESSERLPVSYTFFDPLPIDEGDFFIIPASSGIPNDGRFHAVEFYRHG